MAAILQVALEGKVSSKDLVEWINRQNNNGTQALQDLDCIRAEFVPYFLNYLRDHTAHLLQGCRSASTSPVKTPASVKANHKQSIPEVTRTSTPASSSHGNKSHRIQLFAASPMDSPLASARRLGKPSPNPNTGQNLSFDSPLIGDNSVNVSKNSHNSFMDSLEARLHQSFNTSGDAGRPGRASPANQSRNDSKHSRSHNHSLQSPRTQRRSPNDCPSRPLRSSHRSSLGDFIVSPDPDSMRSWKKSPRPGSRGDDILLSPRGKHSGGKGKHVEPRRVQTIQFEEPTAPVFSLADSEDFPALGSKGPAKKPSRRITPTPISTQRPPSVAPVFTPVPESEPPAPAFSAPVFVRTTAGSPTGLEEERKCLKEEREKQRRLEEASSSSRAPGSGSTPNKLPESAFSAVTPTKCSGLQPSLERLNSLGEPVKAEPDAVMDRDKLDILADIYSRCLSELLVPNLTVELYFLVQLLTIRGGDLKDLLADQYPDCDEENYFSTVHNVVYFAVTVIHQQKSLVSLLDKGTLRLLADNIRICDFNPSLKEALCEELEHLTSRNAFIMPPSPIGGVSFQAETDNRKNFPHDRAFHHFKRQRDMFYELLREWEESRHTAGWCMADAMGERVRTLVGGRPELSNHVHFARLFLSQLVQMCKGDQSVKSEREEENSSLLAELKMANPEKFKRLQERFITPSGSSGPCPSPTFPGCQEFFRDFITLAANHVFNQHLTNCMASRVTELDATPFAALEPDVEADKEDREVLSNCLTMLRLLGKFLGYIAFLPYQTPDPIPEAMHGDYILMRNQCGWAVDLHALLSTAIATGRIIVTVPWVIEYLSMMDSIAPQLSYIKKLLVRLIQIYRSFCWQSDHKSTLTTFMIIVMLGWFFELPVFPEELFFQEVPLEEVIARKLPAGCPDQQDLVDHQLLYACCPYLGELRGLLLGFVMNSRDKGSNIRKITPLSTVTEASTSINERHIQHQLEENFFHNHPASMKRTVEFVADRIASNHIKGFRGNHLPSLLTEGKDVVMKLIRKSGATKSPDRRMKKRLMNQVEDNSLRLASKAKSVAMLDAKGYCRSQAEGIIPLLLPSDHSPQVLEVAGQITCRLAQEKVNTWVTMHLTKGMFEREMTAEAEKQLRNVASGKLVLEDEAESVTSEAVTNLKATASEVTGKEGETLCSRHNEEAVSPSDLIIATKEQLLVLMVGEGSSSPEVIQGLLGQMRDLLSLRQDVLPGVLKILGKLLVDTAYAIVLKHPELWTIELQDHFWSLLTGPYSNYCSFQYALCPKHIHIAQAASNKVVVWESFLEFLVGLLRNHLVTLQMLIEGALMILQQSVSQECVEAVCMCLDHVIAGVTPDNGNLELDVSELLELLREHLGEQGPENTKLSQCIKKLQQFLPADSTDSK